MSFRIKLARYLLSLASFIQSMPVLVMKPDDLVEFSRQSYAKSQDVESWAEESLVDSGLQADELDLLSGLPEKKGKLLLLGVGGGREAIVLAKVGFQVTGVDYVPEMVTRAKENAAKRGLQINGLVQEISKLDVPFETYDVVWISRSMYSCVPTRARRVEMVQRIVKALKPGGYFLCQFQRGQVQQHSAKGRLLRRLIAVSTLGNLAVEQGDMLWWNIEFLHVFDSEDDIRSELEEGGLQVLRIQTEVNPVRGGVVCRKSLASN